MLFSLEQNTPYFVAFELLNKELLFFLENDIAKCRFTRKRLSNTIIGSECWNNTATKDKFKKLHVALQKKSEDIRRQLFEIMRDNQDFVLLFQQRNYNLLAFITADLMKPLQSLCYHLYTHTKGLVGVVTAAGGIDINGHFAEFTRINGQVCKTCGLELVAPFRANVPDEAQWRADYDHLLCKSKYPIFSVHPKNLFPICRTCNQDAKKTKNLFLCEKTNLQRHCFYPYTEGANTLIHLEIELNTLPPKVKLSIDSDDPILKSKLDTWNDVYEIKNLVEGRYTPLEHYIKDRVRPRDFQDLQTQIERQLQPPSQDSLKRSNGIFWDHLFYLAMSRSELMDIWTLVEFQEQEHGAPGGEAILNAP